MWLLKKKKFYKESCLKLIHTLKINILKVEKVIFIEKSLKILNKILLE